MSSKLLGRCPVCGSDMAVTRLKCARCATEISGDFTPCAFCRLDKEQERLITVFLKTRGSIREVERELGISYPTVRARLEEALQALGLAPRARAKGGKEAYAEDAGAVEGQGEEPST
jgi:hypothetical protein